MLTCDHELDLLELRAIGVCSGILGDEPHGHIVMSSQLDSMAQDHLMKQELGLSRSVPDAGRYILAVAQKPKKHDN